MRSGTCDGSRIDKNVPAGLDVHLVCDYLATHKTPAIQEWLARLPRFHLHLTPLGDVLASRRSASEHLARATRRQPFPGNPRDYYRNPRSRKANHPIGMMRRAASRRSTE